MISGVLTSIYSNAMPAAQPKPNEMEEYSKMFPYGKVPPIMDQKKRNRRLSSIVGICSGSQRTGFELDEILDDKAQ